MCRYCGKDCTGYDCGAPKGAWSEREIENLREEIELFGNKKDHKKFCEEHGLKKYNYHGLVVYGQDGDDSALDDDD